MEVPTIAGMSLSDPYTIGVIVIVVGVIGGAIWWLQKEGKLSF